MDGLPANVGHGLMNLVVGSLLHSIWLGAVACLGAWVSLRFLHRAPACTRCNNLLLWRLSASQIRAPWWPGGSRCSAHW